MSDEKKRYDFTEFKRKIQRAPNREDAYRKYGFRTRETLKNGYDFNRIQKILREGDIDETRALSRYYYRTSGIYKGVVNLISNFSLYQTMVTPIFDVLKKISQKDATRYFYEACDFVEKLNVPVTFANITHEQIIAGIYYGLLRQDGDKYVIQDLPPKYCRTRFKDMDGLNIVEFNINYFNSINDENERNDALYCFPSKVIKAYGKNKFNTDLWVELYPSEDGALCFYYGDKTPFFASSIPQIYKMEEAIDRESTRDENELYKLLIQQMPVDKDGNLTFELEEVADMHASVAEMLGDRDTIDIITTFGKMTMESVQDTSAAAESANKIAKYKDTAYDNLGVSSLYFNPDTSSAMPYMIAKDEAFVASLINQYNAWIKAQINKRFARAKMSFDFMILPTTRYNRKDLQSQLFQGAQYGYSKMYAGVALGIPQRNMISLMLFENDFLKMSDKMIPLKSSYTSSEKEGKSSSNGEEKSNNNTKQEDINNTGGRPPLETEEKSERTLQDQENK